MCLYNYATKDPAAFLSEPDRLKTICHMCEHVLNNDEAAEDTQSHAAKLLEVLLLSYKGLINDYVPLIIQLVFRKLFAKNLISELKTMLLMVVVAALYYEPGSVLSILQTNKSPEGEELIGKFLKMWLGEMDCMFGLHDKKMTVLGLTIFMQLPAGLRNSAIQSMAPQFLPASLLLFQVGDAGILRGVFAYNSCP